jgi:acyl carrier protein
VADRDRIADLLASRLYQIVPEARGGDGDLRAHAGFDSLAVLELLTWLEEEFQLEISDEDIEVENFDSVDKIVEYVSAHLTGPGGAR